jgi:transcriptional regulator with XRE-family HTH domain
MPIFELPSIADKDEIDSFLMVVANNVKRIRTEKGVSQFDLALTIGQKGSSLIANAETGTRGKRFNLEHLYKIAKALDVDVREFFSPLEPV